jgi:hypothetical protein
MFYKSFSLFEMEQVGSSASILTVTFYLKGKSFVKLR